MSQAPNYNPTVGFATEETNQVAGRSTVRTVAVDTEFANISSAINPINANLQLIQRDDGKLTDQVVELFNLNENVRSLLASRGTIRGQWQPDTTYRLGDIVQYISSGFVALFPHTSTGAFNYGLWLALSGDGTATQKAIEAAISAASALSSANEADISEAAALLYRNQAEAFKIDANNSANSASGSASTADAAKNTALSAANSAQLNANSASGSAISAGASAALALQYSLLASPIQYAVTTGTASAYEAALTVPITAYVDNQIFKLRFDENCLANATLRVSGVNPPLDIKIQASDGAYVNVAANEIVADHVTLGLVINSGTAILIQPATSLISVNTITTNTTFTTANALDRTFVSNGVTLTHTAPLISAFPVGGSFSITSESAGCTIQRQGSNVFRVAGADLTSFIMSIGDRVDLVNNGTKWLAFFTYGFVSIQNIAQSIGVGQSVQAVTRALVTTYTNATSKPIKADIFVSNSGATGTICTWTVNVNGFSYTSGISLAGYSGHNCSLIIPAGHTYSISGSGGTPVLNSWVEMR